MKTAGLSVVCILVLAIVFAAPPRIMNYQGRLTDTSGVAIDDSCTITFRIYDADTGGHLLWHQTEVVNVVNGLFDAKLDLSLNGGDTLKFDRPYWMTIQVRDDPEMAPRIELVTVSFAFRSTYADTAGYVAGGTVVSGNYIWRQDSSAQDGNLWISGVVKGGVLQAVATTPDTFTPHTGMIRTAGSGPDFNVYIYDGTCWRRWFPEIDTESCYGGTLTVDAGDDTAVCSGLSAELTAEVSGGWPPYSYDWDDDGTGDWDDSQSVTVFPADTTTYHIQVRDIYGTTATDSVTVNPVACGFASALGGGIYDEAKSIAQTVDGGFVVTGYTTSFGTGGTDLFLAKYDSAGVLEWSRTAGGDYGDYGYSVVQTEDSGYVVTGETVSFGAGGDDLFLLKFDAAGSLEWARTMGGSGDDGGYSVKQTADGGYIVGGYGSNFVSAGSDLLVAKFDSAGSLEWARIVGGGSYDYAMSVVQTLDNGYVAAGRTASFGAGSSDFFLVKFDSTGSFAWARTIGGSSTEFGESIVQIPDGDLIVAGGTRSFGTGGSDLLVVKLSSSGSLIWARTAGGSDEDYANAVLQTADDGYILVGATGSFGAGSFDLFLAKFDSTGSFEWAKAIGGGGYDEGYSVAQLANGGYAMAGRAESFGAGGSDFFMVQFNSEWVSCVGETISPMINTPVPFGAFQSPTVLEISPSEASPTITTTSPSPTVTEICP